MVEYKFEENLFFFDGYIWSYVICVEVVGCNIDYVKKISTHTNKCIALTFLRLFTDTLIHNMS